MTQEKLDLLYKFLTTSPLVAALVAYLIVLLRAKTAELLKTRDEHQQQEAGVAVLAAKEDLAAKKLPDGAAAKTQALAALRASFPKISDKRAETLIQAAVAATPGAGATGAAEREKGSAS